MICKSETGNNQIVLSKKRMLKKDNINLFFF